MRTTIEFREPQRPVPAYKVTPPKRKRKPRSALSQLLPLGSLEPDFFRKYCERIEKNYRNSQIKAYRFPRCKSPSKQPQLDEDRTEDSHGSSIESMRGVCSYRLCSQNKKQKAHSGLSLTQRIFGNSREDVLRVFKTEPKASIPKNLHKRSSTPMFMDALQPLQLQARKTQTRRIFFTKTARLRLLTQTYRKMHPVSNPEGSRIRSTDKHTNRTAQ